MKRKERPVQQGLYRQEFEHENCGIGFVAHIKGKKSYSIIRQGLEVLENMNHRGAEGADKKTGDGAGMLIQVPRDFYLIQGYALPPAGQFGTGLIFLPQDSTDAHKCREILLNTIKEEGVNVIGFREVPRNKSAIGEIARAAEPEIVQILLGADIQQDDLERKLYIIRKRAENIIRASDIGQKDFFYLPSLSTKVLVYKGMLTSMQLGEYFLDLRDERLQSAIALVHSRFSTNTFPSWDLAQPFRVLGHNGEINTIKGNRFWMEARESILKSDKLGDLSRLYPIVEPGKSDSASLDNVLEFLLMSGKSLPYAMSVLIPESFNVKNPISNELRSFYLYHSTFLEPWDGPASLIFSDGRYIGGMLDRNGLRPSRYLITTNDLIVMGSETGVQTFPPEEIREKGRLKPGKMLLVDTLEGNILHDEELKAKIAGEFPYGEWITQNMVSLEEIETGHHEAPDMGDQYDKYITSFNYSLEDTDRIIKEMADTGKEPIGSMGNDVPIAVLSKKPYRLFNYFKQLFAQVTNPPIDHIREELVMTLSGYLGSLQTNILDVSPDHVKMVRFKNPVITNTYFQIVKNLRYKGFSAANLALLFDATRGSEGLQSAVDQLCIDSEKAVDEGKNYIILSDRGISEKLAPIPSLMAVSAVHHHLIKKRKRMQIDIVVESAEPREVMHFALLFGYGASIINPYMSFAVIDKLVKDREIQLDYQRAEENYVNSINKGLLKIISKMGISTLRSYRSAQIFEAIGIHQDVIDRYFAGTTSRIGGIGMDEIAEEVLIPHRIAFSGENQPDMLTEGVYSYRKYGEHHGWNPETISLLQWSTRTEDYNKFKEYTKLVYADNARPGFIRGLLKIKSNPIPLDEVEPVEGIMKRFVTGAMSYGSISREAHETLAIAMNRIGGRSNTGEGGEDPERFKPLENGDSKRSAIKQVASGRFGVTTHYLVNADELQIKIAQGAKPGEGGQLPGHKVDKIIAKTRYAIPGITLISPPPHHDIYSIEDLAQLIFDLKNVNPSAKVSVKLVSESGVGTIAAGVTKAGADLITISGYEGGTGASPSSSIKHAGLPLELGLAETQQTLVMNNLRRKVIIQADGQLKSGKDIITAALLGAEEFGFATSALIVLGCVMMRKCHLNTCPVGVATQNAELRKRFRGQADYLVTYFHFLAEEVRENLAEMGYRKLDDIIGRADLLERNPDIDHWKIKNLDLSGLLAMPAEASENALHCVDKQDSKLNNIIDNELIAACEKAIIDKQPVEITRDIHNTDRTTGAMLSGIVTKKHGPDGLPEGTIKCRFKGSAGQSFGAFLSPGIELHLEGDSNDYVGKGLSGGRIIVVPPAGHTFMPDRNIIIGNTSLYGATRGEAYINGVAGERFAVRNSGAIAVVEGVGNHCCEYMTGGRVVVLGTTGSNFAAGMSGGIAYVLNEKGNFDYYCNMGMVELSLVDENIDVNELTDLISRHYKYTNSNKAKMILDDINKYIPMFIKVIPYDYKKVMQEQKLEELKKKIAGVELDLEISAS
ncbi:MAG: glutamate synthase subunit alpha [Bacteroidetes bacterium GWA2_40_15]|nr:MAG: glutamate synthase subunit alpha [Bacteroidetes bacterium GWA2_40_15]OFX93623.1 MAG: glutamate synthase subunit alpha [Bacteroidetes bacterium GWC2_40_22]HBH83620.1 glutamate synthase large subunit [Bacteroidales bacterium]